MWNTLQKLVIQDKFDKEQFDNLWHQLDSVTSTGTTLLHFAVMGNLEMANYLLLRGIAPNTKNDNGETPLHWAAQHGRIDQIKQLIDFGADVNAQDVDKNTALHWVAENDNVDVAKYLLSKGAVAKGKNIQSKTPYKLAVENYSKNCEELLKYVSRKHRLRKRKHLSALSCIKIATPIRNSLRVHT